MAQQQKTDKLEIGDLPDLTEQQFGFVKGLLDGKSASDAYRAAYNCENMKPETIWAAASRLRHNSNVAAWLTASRVAKMGANRLTLEGHLLELESLREMAVGTGNFGAAVNAEVSRGKAAGLYVERHADVTDDPEQALRVIAEIAPDLARQMAAQDKIAWPDETKH